MPSINCVKVQAIKPNNRTDIESMTIKILLKIIQTNRTWNIHNSIRKPDGILQTIVLAVLEHWQAIHELPDRTSHDAIVIGLLEEVKLGLLIFEDYG